MPPTGYPDFVYCEDMSGSPIGDVYEVFGAYVRSTVANPTSSTTINYYVGNTVNYNNLTLWCNTGLVDVSWADVAGGGGGGSGTTTVILDTSTTSIQIAEGMWGLNVGMGLGILIFTLFVIVSFLKK